MLSAMFHLSIRLPILVSLLGYGDMGTDTIVTDLFGRDSYLACLLNSSSSTTFVKIKRIVCILFPVKYDLRFPTISDLTIEEENP